MAGLNHGCAFWSRPALAVRDAAQQGRNAVRR
jgi:hypothetical protein